MNGSQAAEEHHEAVHADMVDQLTDDKKTWEGTSLLSVTQISPSGLNLLCSVASEMRELVASEGGDERLTHKLMASVFYEASTRTACSFQAAMMRLGGRVLHVDGGASGNSSAAKKGETLSDTIRCLQCYTDVTVLRHFSRGSVRQVHDECKAAAQRDHSHQPILNAGDGVGEHPTQALLDLFTIRDELSSFLSDDKSSTEPLVVVLLGDLKHGRTVHSLAKLLARSRGEKDTRGIVLRYCAPGTLEMPANVQEYVATHSGIVQENFTSLTDAMEGAHVLYVTRVQKERFAKQEDYDKVKDAYVVDAAIMKSAPANMVVLHPLPRVNEISTDVDLDPRAAYFRQMKNGMYVRMALLALVLGKA